MTPHLAVSYNASVGRTQFDVQLDVVPDAVPDVGQGGVHHAEPDVAQDVARAVVPDAVRGAGQGAVAVGKEVAQRLQLYYKCFVHRHCCGMKCRAEKFLQHIQDTEREAAGIGGG